MRAIITGATGFVGRNLVKELVENGVEVAAIIRHNREIPREWENNRNVTVIYSDLNELSVLAQSNDGKEHGDIFYHLGWYGTSGVERTDINGQLQNIKNTCDAVRLAVRLGCTTFVNAGSIMEYEIIKLMTSGNYVPNMSTIYSTAKLSADYMGRALANNLGIKYINIIISNIYGVGEKSARFLNTTIRKMLKNEYILLTHGNQLYDFIYITDAVRMMRIASIKGRNNESYYIGNSCQEPLKNYLIRMKDVLKSKAELVFGAISLDIPTITYKEFDTCKMENEFGVKTEIDFETGIVKVKNWLMEKNNE